jgi:hypothetical protein
VRESLAGARDFGMVWRGGHGRTDDNEDGCVTVLWNDGGEGVDEERR